MLNLIPVLAPVLSDVIKRVLPDKDKAVDVEKEVKLALLDHSNDIQNVAGQIILAEAKSESWLTSTWRPLLMVVIIAIVALAYLVFPVVNMFFGTVYGIELPPELWDLLTWGVSGYVVGRSGEKIMNIYKQGGN